MNILDYYKAHLTHIFGEEKTTRIINNSMIYSKPLQSRNPTTSAIEKDIPSPPTEESASFSSNLENTIFPLIGLYRAMLMEGFTEEEVSSFLKSLWDIAPDEIKTPPLQ